MEPFLSAAGALAGKGLAFGLKHWKWIGLGVLVLALGVQSARLGHAKRDLTAARDALYMPGLDGKPTKRTWQSYAQEQEAAYERQEAAYELCRDNRQALQDAIDHQNASFDALKAQGAADTAEAQRRADAAQKAASAAEKRLAALSKPPVGPDSCARVTEAFSRIQESLK